MADDRRISLVIPNYNRVDMLLQSFEKVYNDERISEIIVSDDHSEAGVYYELEKLFAHLPKVKMFRQDINVDCYLNKRQAVELATNDFVILFDSDNILGTDYLDRVFEHEWEADTILAPYFAKPHFDYRAFGNLVISKNNVASLMKEKMFSTLLNTCNYFVCRKQYLNFFDDSVDPVTSDSEYFNYCWLAGGNKIKVVAGMEYFHRVHDESHFKINNRRTNGFDQIVKEKLLALT